MVQYPALLDGEAGAYGVVFPDLPGCVAMGTTVDEALRHAAAALHDYVASLAEDGIPVAPPRDPAEVAIAPGESLVLVPLVRRPAVAWLARQLAQLA